MNPHSTETEPAMDLPKPQAESVTLPSGGENYLGEMQHSQALELGATNPTPIVNGQQASQAVPSMSTTTSEPSQFAMPALQDLPIEARDGERIEQEWIQKAKEIIARTINDPHAQTREVQRAKSDYMRKRFNKEIKLAEDN